MQPHGKTIECGRLQEPQKLIIICKEKAKEIHLIISVFITDILETFRWDYK